jgi:beta-lactamase regulating signal transducer with metallopeptidase domain
MNAVDGFAVSWAGAMVRACWEGGVALGLVWCVSHAWPTLSPRIRCWLWRVAYLKLIVALLWTTPVPLPVLPVEASPAHTATTDLSALRLDMDSYPGAVESFPPGSPSPPPRETPSKVARWLLILWLVGVACFSVRVTQRWWRMSRLRHASRPVQDDRLAGCLRELCRRVGVRDVPDLLTHADIRSPFLLGVFHPVIILPSPLLRQCTLTEIALILAHELAHRRRQDLAWAWLPTLAQVAFFFHPLTWLAYREWWLAQEMACDEHAIGATGAGVEAYRNLLLKVAVPFHTPQHGLAAVGAVQSYQSLKRRLMAMKHFKRVPTGRLLAVGSVLAVLAVAGIVPWQLTAQAPQEQAVREEDVPKEVLAAWRSKLQKPLTFEHAVHDPLQNVLEFLSDRFDVRIRIDHAAFEKQHKAKAVGDQNVWLPKQSKVPMGVVLGALVGQVGGTYELKKDGIQIIPAPRGTTLLERLSRPGPGKNSLLERPLSARSKEAVELREKLSKPVTLEKGIEGNTVLQETLEYLADLFELNIIIDEWAFKSTGTDRIVDQPISMPRLERVPLRMLLDNLCKQINSTYAVMDNIVVIGPQVPPAAREKQKEAPPEQAWKTEFRRDYGLKEGEVLKRIAAPFPASRADYCKSLKADFPDEDFANVTMSYRWDGKNTEFWSLAPDSNGETLITLLSCLGIPSQEAEVDEDWRLKQIPGEFVTRAGAPPERVSPRLEQILRQELKLPVRLTLREVERQVIVVGGKYESKPRANRQANQIDLFAVKLNEDEGAGGGAGTFDEFLAATGSYIGRRLVNELAETPKGRISWSFHNSTRVLPGPDPNQDADGVLKNVTAQTGLTFKTEKRKVRVLFVEKG